MVPTDHPGYLIVEFFDGLHVEHELVNELGQHLGDADIEFGWLKPLCPVVAVWSSRLNLEFVGVGRANRSNSQLWVSNDERYFYSNDMTDHFEYIADGWDTAIANILMSMSTKELLDCGTAKFQDDERFYDWKKLLD